MDDRRAQNQLYIEYYSYGFSICIRYVPDNLEAKAILNEGYYKIFKNIERYKPELDFKPWFKSIMVNNALDYVRKNQKNKYSVPIEEVNEKTIDPLAITNISFDELVDIVRQLPTAYRTVFNLYVLDGYKHSEIASKLGITESTSKSNLSRAKDKLRALINHNILA